MSARKKFKIRSGLKPRERQLVRRVVSELGLVTKSHYIPDFVVEGQTLEGTPYSGYTILYVDTPKGVSRRELGRIGNNVFVLKYGRQPDLSLLTNGIFLLGNDTLEDYAGRVRGILADTIHYNASGKAYYDRFRYAEPVKRSRATA